MSTSSRSQRRAFFRDLPVDTQKKKPYKISDFTSAADVSSKIEANTDERRVCLCSPPFKCSDSASLYVRCTHDLTLTVCTAVHANAYDALSFLLILITFQWQDKL